MAELTTILLVEDDRTIKTELEMHWQSMGWRVQVCSRLSDLSEALSKSAPDVVVLDRQLPDGDSLDWLSGWRQTDPHTPVIVLTAMDRVMDRVEGLRRGADDYVVKPFSVKELLLRVKAVLRRHDEEPKGEAHQLSKGDIQLDVERHEVRVGGKPVVLTALEFRLLKTFLERPGRVQTRETLLSDVWGIDADITTRTVDTHIKRLREKLGPAGDVIETIRGVGYKLVA